MEKLMVRIWPCMVSTSIAISGACEALRANASTSARVGLVLIRYLVGLGRTPLDALLPAVLENSAALRKLAMAVVRRLYCLRIADGWNVGITVHFRPFVGS